MGGGPDFHGYSWTDSKDPAGPEYNWEDISTDGELLTELSQSDDGYSEVALPFTMSLYGEEFDRVYVSSNGYLTFGSPSTDHAHFPLPSTMMPGNLVAPLAMDLNPANGGEIYVLKDQEKIIVQYEKVKDFAGLGEYTFQTVLYRNGVIFFNYKEMASALATTGIQNASGDVGLLVAYNNEQIQSEMTVRVSTSPKWLHVSQSSGTLSAGQSQTIDLILKAGKIQHGTYESEMELSTNDPDNLKVKVPVALTVEATQILAASPVALDFGEVEVGLSNTLGLTLTNEGNAPVSLSGLTANDAAFSTNFSAGTINPGASKTLSVSFQPSSGMTYDSVCSLLSDAENSPLDVPLSGIGLASPKLRINPESLQITVEAGQQASETAVLDNHEGQAEGTYALREIRSGQAAQALTGFNGNAGQVSEFIPEDPFQAEHLADELIVVFKANVDGFANQVNQTEGIVQVRPLGIAKTPGSGAQALSGGSIALVRNETDLSLRELAQQLSEDDGVAYVEPNYIVRHTSLPNDPEYGEQWALPKIQAPEAWDMAKGDASVIVAVIDTGIDYNHPDLQGNLWTNPGEIAGNGIDDDGNGYIDDVRGWDFYNQDNDPMDGDSHGTHVAGTIAASTNNGQLVSGVSWHAGLVGLKFLSDDGWGNTADAIDAVAYCAAMDFPISNNSWGGGGYSQALKDVIAQAGEMGHLFCAAAGNSASDNDVSPHYPSNYDLPSILSIAASNDLDQLAWFSCYGNLTVDMAAPGENILSLIPNGGTASYSGTSMATPHVAGAAALLLSIDPDSGYQKLKNLLMNSVDPIPAFEGKMVAAGRLNLANAVIETSPSWLTVAPESGSVAAGGQTNLVFSADAANFNAGTRNAIAVFETNDPLAPTLEVPVELTITGAPRIVVSQTALDFGTVWTGQSASLGLQVSNLGTDALEVSSIASDDVVFSADQTSLSLNPGQSAQLQITAQPEASSEVTATLTLDSNDQENPAVEVALQVNGILPPSLSVAPTSVSLSLEKDETGEKQLTITNTGEATGEWDAYLIETGASTSNKMNLLNALASIEARVEIPDFRSPRLSMLSAAEVATLEEPEPVVRIEANPNSQLEVAVLGAAFDYENEDIANGLVATEAFGGVTMINVSWVTPTLSELSVFDAILVYSIDPYWDAEALGNVVADYALAGGGVVTASHEGNTHSLAGKWVEEALNLYDIEDNYLAVEETMGDALIPGHPVLLNVESFAGNSLHVRGNPNANAMVVANWSNGTPLVTVREGLTLVADLSFWPVSDQADGLGYFPGWDSSTDGWQLMANCLTWTTNGSAPDWLSADILSGSVLGNSESEMTLLFDATDLPVGNYTAEAHFVTNDPVQAYSRVEVLLVVTENQPPVASSTTLSLLEDQSVSFVLSATDPDGDELSYEILSQPAHGTLTGDAPDLTYVPGTNFNGEDSLTFRVSDGSLSSESAKVTFIVEAVNDAPWAGSQDLNGTEDEFLFLSFDYGDPDGDAVELIITQYPEHGFIWEQNEMMMYFPDNHYHGEDLILFGVNDGSLSSEEASIRINLEPANDAPVAEDLAFETNENQALVFELQATDVDGDEMSFEIISQPQHGELIHLGGVSWQYLPFDQFSGTDSLTYRASDSLIQGNLATVSIVVLEQNDPPVVQASTFTMQEDGEVAIKLIASDPEGDELTFEVIEAPTNGVLAGDGPSYDYYPNTNFNGEDSFTVRANDGELDSEDTLITLIINPENDAPSFAQSTQSTQEGLRETPYRMAILVEDPDNDELTVSLSRDPANGSCYFENEELVYLPQPGFAGVENLMLEVTDGIEVTQATFSVNIMAHDNPVPIAFEGEIDTDLIDMLYQANELLSKTGGRIFELCSNSGDAQVTARMTEEIGEDEAMSMEQWLIDGTALEDVVQFDFVAQEGESGLNWFVAPSLTPVFSADADMDNEGTNITGAPVQENQEELIIEEQPVEETDNESNPIADLEDASLADEAEASSPEADADQPQPAPTEVSSQESEVVEPEAPIHQEEEAIVLVPVTPISDPSETLIDPTTGTESEATVSYDSGTDAEANAGTEASQPATVAEENVPQPEVIVTEESNPQPLPTEESGVTETVVAMIGEDDTLAYIADAPESEASETFIDPTTGTESEATVSHDSGTDAQANAGTEANQPAKVAEENVPQPEVIATKEKANEQNSEDEKVAEVEEVVGAVAPVEKTKEQGPLPTEKAVETEAAPEKEHTSKTNDTGEGILDSKTEKSSKPKTETETDPTKEEEIELSEAIEEETEAPTADESKEDSSESEKEETTEEPTLAELSFTEELGDHWLKAPGVGIFYDAGNGWIFQPSMGWCYLKVCDSECSFWLYQEDLGWIWFDIQTQGMVYAMSDWCNGWLHYTAATFSESTFLYDYENEIWMKW
jgi:subtilisin family serine protease